jgi:hypothetical protein
MFSKKSLRKNFYNPRSHVETTEEPTTSSSYITASPLTRSVMAFNPSGRLCSRAHKAGLGQLSRQQGTVMVSTEKEDLAEPGA